MLQWKIVFTVEANEDLDKLDKQVRQRVVEKMLWLKDNFDQIIPLPLGGKWQGLFKVRVGDWRIIYELEDLKKQITIHRIALRDKVYKRR
ncbi:MAG: type II toxin-antitoxin system RelE/ParE family toxin [bacterium]